MIRYSRRQMLRQIALGSAALATQGFAAGLPASGLGTASAMGAPKSRKKGVCGGIHGAAGLTALRAGWFYTWGSTRRFAEPAGCEWIPQIFPHAKEDIAKSCERVKAGGFKVLLGYNEPDHPGQGNISVEKAIENWPLLMATGLRLVSPAVTWAPNGWMKKFMHQAKARQFRIDAVGIHWYGMPNADAFLKYVEAARRDYGKPIWITEFGINDKEASKERPSKVKPKDVIAFLREVLPELEKLPWVERYCYYTPHGLSSPKTGASGLLGDDGKLTDVGRYFASVQ